MSRFCRIELERNLLLKIVSKLILTKLVRLITSSAIGPPTNM